jgi:hypothetical protein
MLFRFRPVALRRLLVLTLVAAFAASARANQAPTGTVRVNTTSIAAGQQVVVSVDATDADGNLRYINIDQTTPTNGFYGPGDTGTQSPPNNGAYDLGGYFGSRTRDLTLTLNTPGTYVFRGAMNDDSGWHYTANTVSVTVTNANQPPSGTVRVNTSSIYAGQQVVVSVDATDANGNLHYINIDQTSPTNGFYGPGDTGTQSPPNNGAYDLGGYFGSRTRDLTLTLNTPGTYVFRGAMNDDSGWYYTPNTVSVTVINPNQPPTGTVRVNTASIYTGQQVIVSVDATDANGNLHYINIDQTSPTNGFYGPGDTGTQSPPNNGAYDLGGYFGSRTRNLTLTLNTAGTYVFRGAMNDDSGWYYTSNTVSVSVSAPPDTTPPGSPQNLSVSGLTDTGFTVSWTAPSGEAVAGYRVRLDSGAYTDVGTYTSHTFTGLAAGSAHIVEVQARDAATNWSAAATYGVTTSGGGGGAGTAAAVFWMDTNGDGILDKVTGSNSPRFYFYIDSWQTERIDLIGVPVQAWLTTVGNLYAGTLYDNYTRWWEPQVNFVIGYDTHFRIAFRVETEADRPQQIYVDYSRLTDINRNRWYPLLSLPGFATAGWHEIYHDIFDPGLFNRAQYFLVEEGQPVGSVQFKDSAGNDLTENVAVNGTANLFLPANNQVTLNLFHNTGNAVSTAVHQVAWQIRDAIGNILRQGLGINVDFDNIDLGQIAQLVIILDNAASKSVNVSAKSVLVKKVEFLGAFSNLTDYDADFAGSGGQFYNPTGWVLNGANNPVAHVKGVAPTVRVTLVAKPANKTFTLHGYSQVLGLTFESSSQTSSGTDQTVDITSSSAFPGVTRKLNGTIGWDITIDSQFNQANPSGDHDVFLTWGSVPGSGVTRRRLAWAVGMAEGAASPQAIADKLYDAITQQTVLGGGTTSGWALLDPNTTGDCDHIAETMKVAFEMLGAGPAITRRIRASDVAGIGNCLLSSASSIRQRTAADGATEYLVLYFPEGEQYGYGYNGYEGCCEAAGQYHAMGLGFGVKVTAPNDYEMLKALAAAPAVRVEQRWVRTFGNDNPTLGAQVIQVLETVPIP